MTTELEKQFFDTFGIEPRKVKICRNINHCPKKYKLCNDDCKHWQVVRADYPQITDRILLELICIAQQMKNVKVLKAFTLDCLIHDYERNVERISNTGVCQKIANDIKQQVQALLRSNDEFNNN